MDAESYLKKIGLRKAKADTYPNTFTFTGLQNFETEQIGNRDNSSWKKAHHFILTDLCSEKTINTIKKFWISLTQKDPRITSIQKLYLRINDDVDPLYIQYDAAANEVKRGTLQQLFKNYQFIEYGKGELGMSDADPSEPEADPSVLPSNQILSYLAAIRTKPFLLLAGISGTGKSRLVRQLARAADAEVTAGNFILVPVKPNWHDSSELLGYVSRISGKPEYVMTDFVRFLFKAAFFPDVPFFCCLDEMNLAPVEQYFAEYLSVIETRKRINGNIISEDVLIKFDSQLLKNDIEKQLKTEFEKFQKYGNLSESDFVNVFDSISKDGGLRIPGNLVVIGTVNMDDTTFSFSRKVLDRAMSFELNTVDMDEGITADNEELPKLSKEQIFPGMLSAYEANQRFPEIVQAVLNHLKKINDILDRTPFKIAYRSRNEIIIYVIERLAAKIEAGEVSVDSLEQETLFHNAMDEAVSMKILSRIEGDEQRISRSFLDKLQRTITAVSDFAEGEKENESGLLTEKYPLCCTKLEQMREQLLHGFVSFWS